MSNPIISNNNETPMSPIQRKITAHLLSDFCGSFGNRDLSHFNNKRVYVFPKAIEKYITDENIKDQYDMIRANAYRALAIDEATKELIVKFENGQSVTEFTEDEVDMIYVTLYNSAPVSVKENGDYFVTKI